MMCDGYDLTVIAFAMPAVGHEWRVGPSEFGYVFSASIVGVMIGAPMAGRFADKFGRKRILLASVFAFAIAVSLTGAAQTITQLIMARFVSGLGLGGVIPLSIALVGEQSPARHRATLISIATTGMTVGAGLPALAAATLLPMFGWRSLFVIGGATPFLVGLLSVLLLPESAEFIRGRTMLSLDEINTDMNGVLDGRFSRFTPLLWASFATIGFVSYFIQSWTPSIYLGLGRPLPEVAFSVSMYQVCGAIGGLLAGWMMDRIGPRCIPVLFVLAAPCIAILGFPYAVPGLLPAMLGTCGFLMLALQLATNALATISYPTNMRALGVGLGMGAARLGQIGGTVVGGALIGGGLGLPLVFGILAIVLLIGAVVSYALTLGYRCTLV
jgi:MFS transporter, AAHS family, 4-hydroxybenzoate transporter